MVTELIMNLNGDLEDSVRGYHQDYDVSLHSWMFALKNRKKYHPNYAQNEDVFRRI